MISITSTKAMSSLDDIDDVGDVVVVPRPPWEIIPDEVLLLPKSYLDPFEIGSWISTNTTSVTESAKPQFWTNLWRLLSPNPRTGIKKPLELDVESRKDAIIAGLTRGKKDEEIERILATLDTRYAFIPDLRSFLASPDQPGPKTLDELFKDIGALRRVALVYWKLYSRLWILNHHPDRTLKLGDMSPKYKWLMTLWYFSDKGISMHSTIKEPHSVTARLIVPYWNPLKVGQEGYNGELGRVDWAPNGNNSNPNRITYSITTYNTVTRALEESPVPVIDSSVRSTYQARSSDPEYINHLSPVVPDIVVQFAELTGYRNHNFMFHFRGTVTAKDVAKVLLSPGDESWARLWFDPNEIPNQIGRYHLTHGPDRRGRDLFTLLRDHNIRSYNDRAQIHAGEYEGRKPEELRKLCSELSIIINTLMNP